MTAITQTATSYVLARRAAAGTAPASHIRSLDSLRGIAALGVALYHAYALFGGAQFVPHAYLAVDLFFVLSGFILYTRYGGEIASGRTSFVGFARLRIARLYPLYLVVTLLAAALYAVDILAKAHVGGSLSDVVRALVANLAVLPDPLSARLQPAGPLFPFVIAAWSVFWEFVFSGLFFFWTRSRLRGSAWPLVAAICVVAAILGVWAASHHGLDGGWVWANFPIGGLRALMGFACGILVARCVAVLARPERAAIARPAIGFGVAMAAAAAGYIVLVPQPIWQAELACALVAFPAIVCAFALWRSSLVENRLGDLLGGASYSLYIWHDLTIIVATALAKRLGLAPSPLLGVAWLAATLVFCWLSWTLLETPARRWVQGLGRTRRAASAALARA
jgi:peptidoglycan/LPS O-acetylase OafA/YrhL